VRSRAPGRVNIIGDHTDYTEGLVLPMAIDLATTVTVERGGTVVRLESDFDREPAVIALGTTDPAVVATGWARYVAAVVAEVAPSSGATGTVTTTLPVGAGLSSSAALEVAVALALGCDVPPRELAQICRRAEQRASGVPCGIMDQLTSVLGVPGALLLIDCRTLDVTPVAVPDGVVVVGVHSGEERALATSAYAVRRAECEEAARELGPLRDATLADVASLVDPVLRARARHVVSENGRVEGFAAALASGDLAGAGALMGESHASLRNDFEVSTPGVDALVAHLAELPGVWGARMTGGGFGGVVVALCDPGVDVAGRFGGWTFRPSSGATVETLGP
jgi:galactokinase